MKHNHVDLIICLVLVLFSLAIWLPSRYYPYFWDSTYIVKTASQIYDSNFTNLTSQEPGYAHTTLLPVILAILWKIFGFSILPGHIFMGLMLPTLLIASYFFFKTKTNTELALIGAFLIGFTPVVLAEYVNFYSDLTMAAFVALSVLCWTKRRYVLWGIFFIAAILTKIPAIAILPYFILDALRSKNSVKLQISMLVPALTVISWFTYHRLVSGWWFINTNSDYQLALSRNPSAVAIDWVNIFISLFVQQGRSYVTLIALLALLLTLISKPKPQTQQILSLIDKEMAVLITATLLFAATGEFGTRYAIFTLIFLYSVVLQMIFQIHHKGTMTIRAFQTGLVVILIFFTTLWRPTVAPLTTNVFTPPDDLGIIDYIAVFRWLSSYVTMNHNQDIAYYGAFPENISLMEPRMGFVSQPTTVYPCKDFAYNPSIKQVIIMHPFSPDLYPCFQLIQQNNFPVLTGKEENGRWLDLYLASPSASPRQ